MDEEDALKSQHDMTVFYNGDVLRIVQFGLLIVGHNSICTFTPHIVNIISPTATLSTRVNDAIDTTFSHNPTTSIPNSFLSFPP